MSTTPSYIYEPVHVSGTTWAGLSLKWETDATLDAPAEPFDFSNADAQLIFYDADGVVTFDWQVSDPLKPGLRFDDDPTTGRIYIDGPGILVSSAGTLRGPLKIWHWDTGEVFVDVEIILPIQDLP